MSGEHESQQLQQEYLEASDTVVCVYIAVAIVIAWPVVADFAGQWPLAPILFSGCGRHLQASDSLSLFYGRLAVGTPQSSSGSCPRCIHVLLLIQLRLQPQPRLSLALTAR